jgi:hypothetical protein
MSILNSTTSGQALVKPTMIDFMTAGFHLSSATKRYKYQGSDALTLDVEFEDKVSEGRTFVVKNAICPVWKDGVEYRMYITTRKELSLVEDYFHLSYYKATSDVEVIQLEVVRDKIITIAQEQWKRYKEQKLLNRK